MKNISRILSFRLGGTRSLPTPEVTAVATIPEPPASVADEATLARGKDIYYGRCVVCHGESAASGGVISDLRYASAETHAAWDAIVLGGSQSGNGMPGKFGQILTKADSDAVHAFVIDRARRAYVKQQSAAQD